MSASLVGSEMCIRDSLKCVCPLASRAKHWGPAESERLRRLMCYIAQSMELRLVGWCGDSPDALIIRAFADADFASDRDTAHGTTGGCVVLMGPDARFVVSTAFKKQTA
eukprot:9345141-Alexandrium_andersonii.AAC.1